MADSPNLHPVLQRQLRRLGIAGDGLPPDVDVWRELLQRVSRCYQDADQERYTLERSLQVSGQEMQRIHDDLRNSTASQAEREAQKLRAVVTAIGEGLVVLDGEGRVIFANPVAAALLGHDESSLLGEPLLEFVLTGPAGNRTRHL